MLPGALSADERDAEGTDDHVKLDEFWAYSEDKGAHSSASSYHHYLSRFLATNVACAVDADSLNADLVGIQGADAVLAAYEKCVGFRVAGNVLSKSRLLCEAIDEGEVTRGRKDWDSLVHDLLEGEHGSGSEEGWLTMGVPELTSSERSAISYAVPETPKPAKRSYAKAVVADASPSPRLTKRLNAAASSFVPSFSSQRTATPSPSPPLSPSPSPGYSFPSLNSSTQSLPPTLQKDESGFYSAVSPPPRTQSLSPFLSSFLGAGPASRKSVRSRTREIVDELRLAHAQESKKHRDVSDTDTLMSGCVETDAESGSLESTLSEFDGDDNSEEDGWICPGEGKNAASADLEKARRTRNLMLALGQRRESGDEKDWEITPPSVSRRIPLTTTDDGWIEAISPPEVASSIIHTSRPPVTSPSFPALPQYIPAPYAAVAYMQLQAQTRGWYRAPVVSVPLPIPVHQRSLSAVTDASTGHVWPYRKRWKNS
ncbi:hypothetical protein PLICRDRAFT_34432 [Plicaturopsis crispa FD-325 SS-3]|nr:hypothetical protein PLICRDRAFT_34432 [Plicaturopsis crispa FD-325 SS-3]